MRFEKDDGFGETEAGRKGRRLAEGTIELGRGS